AIPSSWRRMSAGWAAPLTPQYAEDGTPVDYVGVPWARPAAGGGDAWDIVIDAHTFARVPQEIVYAAAADHCLAPAYRGECPGVDPDALMRWRAASRAAFQRRAVEAVLADVERARAALREAPVVSLAEGIHARDLRGPAIPEPPEAAAREGECFLASLRERDGKTTVVCQSGTAAQIDAFMRVWAPAQGLTDIYGDPARGFAGGYKESE